MKDVRTYKTVGLVVISVWLWCFRPLSALSWQSVLLLEENGIPGENRQPGASH